MDTAFFERKIYHNSRMNRFRNPQGALPCGSSCRLGLYVHRDAGSVFCSVHIIQNGETLVLPMFAMGGGNDDEMLLYYTRIPPFTSAAPAWYYFSVELDGGTLYYGVQPGTTGGQGRLYTEIPPSWQITVYKEGFKTPDWFKHSVMYQIFPDRFFSGDIESAEAGLKYHGETMGRTVVRKYWNELPLYEPVGENPYYQPCDYFLGDLDGIIKKLDYIEGLGIGVIYLNPIFEADSNHRYNTADYMNIDPILGDNATFERLCEEAKKRGVRIMLDGVFSHTGSDSVYFNREGKYKTAGAYQSKSSPYYSWYDFMNFPDVYRSWWGFPTLPEVNETNPDWSDFVIKNKDSVLKSWIKKGAFGWRLDVADELPDEVIVDMRKSLKEENPEAVLLGEVWEDATNKQFFGQTRTYAFGDALDSVMNYPFRNTILDFLLERMNSGIAKDALLAQAENYPKEMYFSLMNLLGSHDVQRLRTVLGGAPGRDDLPREKQAVYHQGLEQRDIAREKQKLAAMIQFTLPGVPCVYYGDEAGLEGMADPFNRGTYPWGYEDLGMVKWYQQLSVLRNEHITLRTGFTNFAAPDRDVISIIRLTKDKDVFGEAGENTLFIALVNSSFSRRIRIVLDLRQKFEGAYNLRLTDDETLSEPQIAIGQASFELDDCILEGSMLPLSCVLIRCNIEKT